MKTLRTCIPVIAILILFASCSNEQHFTKRKYLPGFFNDRTGKNETAAAEHKSPEQAYRTDSVPAKTVFTSEAKQVNTAEQQSADSIPAQQQPVSSLKKKQADNTPLLIPEKNNTTTDEPVQDFDEQKRIRLALIFSLIAVAVFLAIVIAAIVGTVGLFSSLGLLVALGCSITGMVLARKVRLRHLKGEQYEGKTQVIFARIIGITGIVLSAAFLALLAFAIAVFAYGW